jgi:shikimate kinase
MSTLSPIVIVGFMGSGKTEVARYLARALDKPMIDLDEAITSREGRSPARLIVEDGETSFRAIETKVLRELLETHSSGVLALGGGAWIQKTNRDLIEQNHAVTVWLDAPFDLCWRRIVGSAQDRPLSRTIRQARELFLRRRPIYGLAQVRITVRSKESVGSVANRIQTEISSRVR